MFRIHEDAPTQRRVVFNRAFKVALCKCAPEPKSASATDQSERDCEERLQKVQQELVAAEEARQDLMKEIEQLREIRAMEQWSLELCRKEKAQAELARGHLEEKLKRCRDVVSYTVDSMDNFYAQKEAMAEGETTDLRCLQAAQARVVQAGVAATGLLTMVSDEDSNDEQDSGFDLIDKENADRRPDANCFCPPGPTATDRTQENLVRHTYGSKKASIGKQERSPYRPPLCELNSIS